MKRELEQLRNRLQVRRSVRAVAVCERAVLQETLLLWRRMFSCVLVQEESLKVRAETKLDINLESSRISDMVCVCAVTLTHKPDIHIYDVLFSSRHQFERQRWSCRDTERHADAHFVFCCQFTEQEKKLMEATTEFHQKVNGPNKTDHQRAQIIIISVCWRTNDPVPWLVVIFFPSLGDDIIRSQTWNTTTWRSTRRWTSRWLHSKPSWSPSNWRRSATSQVSTSHLCHLDGIFVSRGCSLGKDWWRGWD